MREISLGNGEIKASQVALGIMRMGAKSVTEAQNILETVADQGLNFIDSADIYHDGHSEEVFGQALKQSSLKREDLIIQSKAGIVLEHSRTTADGLVFGKRYDFSKEHLLTAVDGILSRMGLDYLDSFLLHRPDPLMEVDEVAEAFNQLQASGKVRAFGVSNFNSRQIDLLQSAVDQKLIINQVQLSLKHTPLIDQGLFVNRFEDEASDRTGGLLEYAQQNKITLQAWSPYQYGMFKGVFIDNPKFPELNQVLQTVAAKYGVTKNAIATAWITRLPQDIQVILGSMNPVHLKESLAGADIRLTRQEWYDLYLAAGHQLP